MKPIKLNIAKHLGVFDESSLRQRIMIAAAVLITLHAAWDQLINQPQVREQAKLAAALEANQGDLSRLSQEIQVIASTVNRDNGVIDRLSRQITDLDAQIELASSELIAPERMPDVLQELLADNAGLQVVGLKSRPAQRVTRDSQTGAARSDAAVAQDEQARSDGDTSAAIYRHDFTIDFEGDYLSTLEYIRSVEQLGWRVFWDSVSIDSSEYPRSRVTVSVYTLSLEEGWIGV